MKRSAWVLLAQVAAIKARVESSEAIGLQVQIDEGQAFSRTLVRNDMK